MIRSRAQISKDWEKPSTYFLNLEKRNYIKKSIPSLYTVDGKKITDSKDILLQQHDFYSNLYASKGVRNIFTGDFLCYLNNMTKLTDFKKDDLDRPYTVTELEFAIRASKLNKAPPDQMDSVMNLKKKSQMNFYIGFLDTFKNATSKTN